MSSVADASVAVRWMIEASGSDRARNFLRTEEYIIAPDLIMAELTNAVWKAIVFEGLSPTIMAEAIAVAENAFHELVPSVELKNRALSIALELRHSVYDCFYLALAEQRQCAFVTADARLLRRCANTPFGALMRPL
jgi:predicted nucleic acid-binding protein